MTIIRYKFVTVDKLPTGAYIIRIFLRCIEGGMLIPPAGVGSGTEIKQRFFIRL